MKASRSYLMVVALSLAACAAVMVVALGGHFRSLERGGAGQSSEKRTNDTLQFFHAQLKTSDGPEAARAQLKAFENLFGHGPESEAVDRIKKAYGPVVAAFASQPKEAEARFLVVKKRELMEALVNAYRKEIPSGSIRLRAAYLNILFDTQNSLLNDDEQLEEVYLRRTKERMAALRSMAASGDAGLQARVSNIDGIVAGFEKGLDQRVKWLGQRTEALARAEKTLPKLARDLRGSRDDELDDQRRGFLYTSVAAALVLLMSLVGIYANHKIMRLRFEARIDTFLRFLRAFGRERGDPALDREFRELTEDHDWGPLMAGGLEAEADFISKHQTLIAVPRSMGCAYVVFDKDRVARHWNERASQLLGLKEGPETTLAEVARADNMNPREGDSVSVSEMIGTAFSSPKEDVFELLLKVEEEWVPVEILADPVKSGPLAGGKVFLFREIRSEAARVDRAVAMHLSSVRDRVHKITHGYPVAEFVASSHPEVKAAHDDLGLMKRKVDEREALWASEAGALTDQVVRQKEILTRLGDEIRLLREAHGQVQDLVATVHGGEEHWHDEVCVLDRELARWRTQRERLESDLNSYGQVLERARKYESEVRVSASGLANFLEGFESVVAELRRFSEEAKVQAVNLSFIKDSAYWEFASHARAYANEIGRFVDQSASLAGRVRQFVDRHPGNSLAPHLESLPPHAESVRSLKEEEERFAAFLARWKESGGSLVKDGEVALDILREAEKKGAVCTQLGDTILLINEQAQGNLERWT